MCISVMLVVSITAARNHPCGFVVINLQVYNFSSWLGNVGVCDV